MSFQFFQNLTIVLSAAGILGVFLRRVPEVVEEKGQMRIGTIEEVKELNKPTVWQSFFNSLQSFAQKIWKSIWHFALEAKDLKQGQILASKFSKMVMPNQKRVINMGVHATLKKADGLFTLGRFDEAETEYIDILKKSPHEYAVYEGLVKVYLKQKKYDEIVEVLEYLIRHQPKNDGYLVQLGNVLMTVKRYKEAITLYERSIEINALVPSRFVNVALCYQALHDLAQARKNFQKALDLDPTNVQYLMMLVEISIKMGDSAQALKRLSEAAEMDPENLQVKEKIVELNAKL